MHTRRLVKTLPWLGLALIALWPLLIVNRGFDLTDSGYYLAHYRYAFSEPGYLTLFTILSTWLGGLIYALVPGGQLLAINIAAVAIYAAIAYWSFVILREHFPDWLVLISLAISSLYATSFFYSANYNTFSYLFLSAAIFLIYRGLQKDKKAFLLIGAALLGFNVFVRLPNILQWALAIAPLWYYWVCLGQRGRGLRLGLSFTLVLLAAFIFMAGCALVFFGQEGLEYYWSLLLNLFQGSKNTGHGAVAILDRLSADLAAGYHLATVYTLPLLGGSALILALMFIGRHHPAVLGALSLSGLVIGLFAGFLLYYPQYPAANPYSPVFSFYCLAGPAISLAGLLHYHKRDSLLSTLCGMGAVVFLAMSVGSDFGVGHYVYYCHLSMGLCLGLVYRFWREAAVWLQKRRSPDSAGWLKAATWANMILWAMLGLGVNFTKSDYFFKTTFWDAPYRLLIKEVEGVGVLAGMRTNQTRAKALSRLAETLAPFEDSKIVAFGQCPMCLMLTEAKPFFKDVWIDLYTVTGDDFIADLNKAAGRGEFPVVLVSKIGRNDPWRLPWQDQHKQRLLNIFLRNHKYVLYSTYGSYYFYLPPELAQAGPIRPATATSGPR